MISPAYATTYCADNGDTNRRVYAAARLLSDAERTQDRGAFCASIHGTFYHLLWRAGSVTGSDRKVFETRHAAHQFRQSAHNEGPADLSRHDRYRSGPGGPARLGTLLAWTPHCPACYRAGKGA